MKRYITLNGKRVEFSKGEKLIAILSRENVAVPSLCFHPDLEIKASCRLCMVETDGALLPACSTEAVEGMIVKTDTDEISRTRKTNLELIFAQHCEECADCVWFMDCNLLNLAKEYGANIKRFSDRKEGRSTFKMGPVEFDSSKCIDCRNCIEVCDDQGVGLLRVKERGHLREVIPSEEPTEDCVHCGQCILHCPAGAFEAVDEFEGTKRPLAEEGKIVVFQIAPAVRVSVGEEFGLPTGTIVTDRLVSSLKALGADHVFDVSSGADFTTIEEAREILSNKGPILTSCCPSWVKYVERYHPELIPNLASTRSPHIILGGIVKTFWANRNGIDPRDISVISLMPCVSKKFEIEREELEISGMRPVDRVMTVREAARMMKGKGINLAKADPTPPDDPFGQPSGFAINYGTSGGVMASAFGHIGVKDLDFREVSPGIRETEAIVDGKKVKAAVVNGLGNAKRLIENGIFDYHCVEVMACPGGCVGGGGQPVPSDSDIKAKRRDSLREAGEKTSTVMPDHNPAVKEVYDFLGADRSIFHTKYRKR